MMDIKPITSSQKDCAIAIGWRCAKNATQGARSIAFGYLTASGAIQGDDEIAIGTGTGMMDAANQVSGINPIRSVAIGWNAAKNATRGPSTLSIGPGAAMNATQGENSVAIGTYTIQSTIQGKKCNYYWKLCR
jgi:hypothetical protein